MTGNAKFDAALGAALSRVDSTAEGLKSFEVTVRMAAPLTPQQVGEAAQHGVRADTRRTIFSSRLEATGLHKLAALPFVSRVSLSQQMTPLASNT